jgi:hypothetical protein
MSMSAIVTTPAGAPGSPPQPLTFLLTLAAMQCVLTAPSYGPGNVYDPGTLSREIPAFGDGQGRYGFADGGPNKGASPPYYGGVTPSLWAAWIAPTPNVMRGDPVLIKQILCAALVGGGMQEADGVADQIFRASPLGATALCAQIVNACVAAG